MTCDLLIKNAVIFDGEKILPDANCVIVKDNKIFKVCSTSEAKHYEANKTIDAKDNFLTPGFVEAHGHFMYLGNSLAEIDLNPSKSWDKIISLISKKSHDFKKGEWIIGNGWHQEKWNKKPNTSVGGYPTHQELSATTPDNPVMLLHANLHTMMLNQKAMDILGVNNIIYEHPEQVLKDKTGLFTGIFEEDAMIKVKGLVPQPNNMNATYDRALQECLKHGITYFHEAATSPEEILFYKALEKENKFDIRLNLMAYGEVDSLQKIKDQLFFKSPKIRCQSVKTFADGALGSRTAWMHDEYSDAAHEHGQSRLSNKELKAFASFCFDNQYQLCVHAIGDQANSQVLSIFNEFVDKEMNRRWRVEHAQHIQENHISLFQKTGTIASVQPNHCTSDAPYAESRLGKDRIKEGGYQWRKFLDHNIPLVIGTDVPVEPINPFKNMYAAITRKSNADSAAFYPQQKLTRIEALQHYTSKNHFSSFDESRLGKIKSGYLADITIVDRNLMMCSDEDILGTQVTFTIVDGDVVWGE